MLFASSASAATVNLMRGGDISVNGGTASFDVDGVSGTISAYSMWTNSPNIHQGRHGIGVNSGWGDDTWTLDGLYDEWLTFTFDKAVKLISVTFSRIDPHDTWDIYVGKKLISDESNSNPYHFGGKVSTSFTVLADGHRCNYYYCKSKDNFAIKSFSVAPVPLPASALLLIGGLAGLGFMRRRQKAA